MLRKSVTISGAFFLATKHNNIFVLLDGVSDLSSSHYCRCLLMTSNVFCKWMEQKVIGTSIRVKQTISGQVFAEFPYFRMTDGRLILFAETSRFVGLTLRKQARTSIYILHLVYLYLQLLF